MTTNTHTTNPSPAALRHAFGALPTGVALIAAELDGQPVGMLASSLATISLEPPLVQMSFDRSSTTWPRLRAAPRAGISVLSADNQKDVALLRRPTAHRFDAVPMTRHPGGALTLPNAISTYLVAPYEDIDAGDHVTRLFTILEASRRPDAEPLVFYNSAIAPLRRG